MTVVSKRTLAAVFAVAASAALFFVLMADRVTVHAQTDATPAQGGPVVVWETAIPEDWPAGQASHFIMSFEAYAAGEETLTFTLRESADTAKFSLIPAGVNAHGSHIAHLVLREGQELDYETQSTYLIGVQVSAGVGPVTEILLRLRITDVDETIPTPTASPAPTPTTSPVPTPTAPADPCFEPISGSVSIVRSWSASCLSVNRPNAEGPGDYYARFFTFSLEETATVTITLTSEVDTYLYLMNGSEKDGEIEAKNDDIVPYSNFNSGIEDQELNPGDYTVEATAFDARKSGNFMLTVSGLPDIGQPQSDCSTGAAVPNPDDNTELVTDCETLLGLRDMLAGSGLLNWSANVAIENWNGISVSSSPRRVTHLSLDQSGLDGTIPSGLGSISALEVLSLSGNDLSGTIPTELGNLSNLTELSVDANRLTGEIPAELGNLANLRTLSLDDNRLSGQIPVELADLSNLQELNLSGNSLRGCIPPALQDTAANDLSELGLLPCASGRCSMGSAVENPAENPGLVVDCNALLGMMHTLGGSASLNWSDDTSIEDWEGITTGGSPRRVTHLELNSRGLTGRLPRTLGTLSELQILWLTNDKITGGISAELGSLSNLKWLNLSGNQLSGGMPAELGGLASLELLNFSDNRLSGEIPGELGNLSNLKDAYLQNNLLDGQLPPELGDLSNLENLILSGNLFSGEIPAELGGLSSLTVLNLDRNRLEGSIPGELADLSNMTNLHLAGNRLSGEIPRELGSLTSLEALHLSRNRLTGEIPPELGAIPNLKTVRMGGNALGGCIPQELRDVPDNDFVALGLMYCDEGACAGGTAVEDPNDNRGLVADCQALLAAKDGLRGTATLNWSTDIAVQDWEGVTIGDSPRRVIELTLNQRRLDGAVPPELGNLAKLEELSLSGNQLSGTIPERLVRLASLETLSLSDNQLDGKIPHQLTRLSNLKELHLSGNSLSGCIPDELEDVENNDLDALGLLFCGKIDCSSGTAVQMPDDDAGLVADCEILLAVRDTLAGDIFLNWSANVAIEEWDGITVGGSTKRITHIRLSGMGLNGEIPPELGRLSNLEELSVDSNRLSGEIPPELGELSNLKVLKLDHNQLSGRIPPELGVLNQLEELKISGNGLTGCVPEQWRNIAANDFEELGLSFCGTGECSAGAAIENPEANPGLVADCGTLLAIRDKLKGDEGFLNWSANRSVAEWIGVTVGGSPGRVTDLNIRELKLSGEIPSELSRLSNLETLALAGNRLSGGIPTELGEMERLKTLSLARNRLTGEIPSELGNLSSLETLALDRNQFTGAIPAELGNLSNLKNLYIYNNRLSDEIPEQLGDLSSLDNLYIYGNRLSGEIPPEIGKLASLRRLYLTTNRLSGQIPSELGDMASLVELHLSSNDLSGAIPSELGNLSKLEQLRLSQNQLTGDIPAELGNLSNLEELYLFGNRLSGCIPGGLQDVPKNDLSLLNLPDCKAGG